MTRGGKSLPAVARACIGGMTLVGNGARKALTALEQMLCAGLLLFALACCPAVVNAAPSDCMDMAPDGLAKCIAPQVSGFTYMLCSSSLLPQALKQEEQCYANIGSPNPIKQESQIGALISCMHGTSGPIWKSSGSAESWWCSNISVTRKYGQEVRGVSEVIPYDFGGLQPLRFKTAVCPDGFSPVGGEPNLPDYCKQLAPPKCPCEATPNPMGIANGDHSLIETDIRASGASPLEFTRYYVSSSYYRPVSAAALQTVAYSSYASLNADWNVMPGFGDYWRHGYDRKIVAESGPYLMATALRPDGTSKHFRPDGSSVLNEDGRGETLQAQKDTQGNVTGWIYTTTDSVELYAATGELLSITTRSGRSLTLVYSTGGSGPLPAGLLLEVDDDVGHSLKFAYDARYRVISVTDSSGNVYGYGYGGGDARLSAVTYPGGASRTYLYNENPQGRNGGVFGLTGIVDEYGTRVATYGYPNGSVQAYTEHAGGIDRYVRTVVDDTHVNLVDPLGATRNYTMQNVAGVSRVAMQTQPAGYGSAASTSTTTYDSAGNVASRDDFDGHRSCLVNDTSRLLETVRVEGLATTVACTTVTGAGATLPAGSRKISTQWHTDWKISTRKAEPARITTYVYNGQPDPTAGGAVASCAPSNALLPGGKPIAVLCAKVEQATLDVDGKQGFSASLDAATPPRRTSYTYNARGQVLTMTDPRGNTSTYVYYETTSANATKGDLQSLTNSAGHVTTYDTYDPSGLLLQSTDPNGTVTTMGYDNRRRPASVSVASNGVVQATSYTYNDSGDLTQVVLPDGTTITSNYDVAHRLIGVVDAAGNTVTYTLDSAGNRIGEQVKDASGTLARSIARAYDVLNRVYSVTGAAQ